MTTDGAALCKGVDQNDAFSSLCKVVLSSSWDETFVLDWERSLVALAPVAGYGHGQ